MKSVGVFFGSRSPEHDVSIITGHLVLSGLIKLGFAVQAVYIDPNGKWIVGEKVNSLKYFTDPKLNPELKKIMDVSLDLSASNKVVSLQEKKLFAGKNYSIDIAFPAFHGQYGEDGTFQGMCEMLNIPYVGCDTASSAVAMDKVLTKLLYQADGIPTTKFVHFTKYEWKTNKTAVIIKITNDVGTNAIVKPARLGSSIGIAKSENKKDLEQAIEVALHYDDKVLVEETVKPLVDITCAVLGGENPKASYLQESVFSSDVFSYEDKYLNNGGAQLGNAKSNIVIPARLDKETTAKIRDMAVKIFKLIGCNGTARVDFLYNPKTKKYFANEVNTMPGTLYHHLWKASGVELSELLQTLIDLAKKRHEEKSTLTHTFKSSLLSMANSQKLQLKKS